MPGRNLRHATAGCVIDHAEAPNGCQQTGPTGGLWTRPLGLNRRIIDYKCVFRYRTAPSGPNFLFDRNSSLKRWLEIERISGEDCIGFRLLRKTFRSSPI